MFVVFGDDRLSLRRGEMWGTATLELNERICDSPGVGAVRGRVLQTLTPLGLGPVE